MYYYYYGYRKAPAACFRSSFSIHDGEEDKVSTSAINFFKDGGIGNSIGKNFEKDVRFFLFDRGYRPFMMKDYPRSVGSYAEIYSVENTANLQDKGSKAVEIDPLMTGSAESFADLCDSIEDSHIPEGCHLVCSAEHLLIVEAKLSLTTFLKDYSERKKTPSKSWWLLSLTDSHPFLAKALFLDGGEPSLQFISKGKFSEVEIERDAWNALDKANVMIFYLPSFSVDWVRGTREEIKRLQNSEETSKIELKQLKDSDEASKIEIKRLSEDLQELKKKLK